MNLFHRMFLLMVAGWISLLCAPVAQAAEEEMLNDQIARQKVVDDGGSGRYRAIVVSEKTLPDFTIYRPRDVQYAARREGALPILIWCNGACSGSSFGYQRMLNEMASHGYVVVGIGAFEMEDSERDDGGSDEKMVGQAITWLVKQSVLKTSDYYKAINVNNIALSGHSCGGAQAIANCGNSRVKTLLIMNAGMGGMSMGGASPQTLQSLHCPIIYMTGGTGDVAYDNAKVDFNTNVTKQPVAWADLSNAGHGGTYYDKYGGEFGRIALKWMDWHLKGYKQNARIFLKPDLAAFSKNWSVKTRNFSEEDLDYDAPFQEVETVTRQVFDRAAAEEQFEFGADVSSLNALIDQKKKFYDKEGTEQSLFPILKEQGINSIRLRVLANSTDYTWTKSRALANMAQSQAFSYMLDLHYSDWWGEYMMPTKWKNADMEKVLTQVKTYTKIAVKFAVGSENLRWVQIGNETDNGMMWKEGRDMETFVSFVNAAYDVVKEENPDIKTVIHVSKCEDAQWLKDYFDELQAKGAKWDAIGLSVHVQRSSLTPNKLIDKVVENVKMLKERYGKPVLIVETGYYIDRPMEANQWLCDFLVKLMDAGASGLYYWEPELTDDYNLGAWNPRTMKPSIVMDAFLGIKHFGSEEEANTRVSSISVLGEEMEYYTPDGIRLSRPQRGLNIIRQKSAEGVKTYKMFQGK